MTVHLAKNGWRAEETKLLALAAQKAHEQGTSLRSVFEDIGIQLGRKPNSVRNYYYLQLRENGDFSVRRAEPFVLFEEAEVEALVRQVILAQSRGESVRSCVLALSGGDKTVMLRYQNKYRSVLRKKPEMIRRICEELKQEGIPCIDPLQMRERSVPPSVLYDPKNQQALDRLKVQADLMQMQLEDLQSAARAVVLLCKEFLGLLPEERQGNLNAFCQALTGHVAVLENAAN